MSISLQKPPRPTAKGVNQDTCCALSPCGGHPCGGCPYTEMLNVCSYRGICLISSQTRSLQEMQIMEPVHCWRSFVTANC